MKLSDLYRAVKTGYAPDLRTMGYARILRRAAASVIKTLSGALPLSFAANGTPLLDYTLYGDAGQGVGDRTANLLDLTDKYFNVGSFTDWSQEKTSSGFELDLSTISGVARGMKLGLGRFPAGTYTLSLTQNPKLSGVTLRKKGTDDNSNTVTLTIDSDEDLELYVIGGKRKYSISDMMLNEGETALPYEPYGFKIPVFVKAEDGTESTTVIYLNKPLYKVGDYADYLCYSTQSITRYCGTDDTGVYLLAEPETESIDLPSIPTFEGTTTINTSTAVKPSNAEIKYRS